MSSEYNFVTLWQIAAPLERVWAELIIPEQWPTWWRGLKSVERLQPGLDPHGTGAVRRYIWQSRLPYQLKFTMKATRIEPMSIIEGHATGELEGRGIWQLSHSEGITHIRYDWHVVANKWWMRRLAWIARPLFEWNHDVIMEWGREGLLSRLGIDSKSKRCGNGDSAGRRM